MAHDQFWQTIARLAQGHWSKPTRVKHEPLSQAVGRGALDYVSRRGLGGRPHLLAVLGRRVPMASWGGRVDHRGRLFGGWVRELPILADRDGVRRDWRSDGRS